MTSRNIKILLCVIVISTSFALAAANGVETNQNVDVVNVESVEKSHPYAAGVSIAIAILFSLVLGKTLLFPHKEKNER